MAATGDTFPTAGSVSGGGRVGHRLEVKFKFSFEFLNLVQECDWLSCCFTFCGNGLALSSFDFNLFLVRASASEQKSHLNHICITRDSFLRVKNRRESWRRKRRREGGREG